MELTHSDIAQQTAKQTYEADEAPNDIEDLAAHVCSADEGPVFRALDEHGKTDFGQLNGGQLENARGRLREALADAPATQRQLSYASDLVTRCGDHGAAIRNKHIASAGVEKIEDMMKRQVSELIDELVAGMPVEKKGNKSLSPITPRQRDFLSDLIAEAQGTESPKAKAVLTGIEKVGLDKLTRVRASESIDVLSAVVRRLRERNLRAKEPQQIHSPK